MSEGNPLSTADTVDFDVLIRPTSMF